MSELSADARALIEVSRSGDEPLAHDKARVKRRLVAELGAGAFALGALASTTAGGGATAGASWSATSVGVSGGAHAGTAGIGGVGAGASVSAATSVGAGTLTGAKAVGAALWWKALVTGVVAASGAGMLYAGAALVGPTQEARRAPPAVASHAADEPPPSSPASAAVERPETSAAAGAGEVSSAGPARMRMSRRGAGRKTQAVEARAGARERNDVEARASARERNDVEATRAQVSPNADSLSAELALLAQAQRALREQRPAEALRLAREHEADFPEGALAEERAGIETLARCLLGEPSEEAARAFLARAPRSPLAARVRSACGVR